MNLRRKIVRGGDKGDGGLPTSTDDGISRSSSTSFPVPNPPPLTLVAVGNSLPVCKNGSFAHQRGINSGFV